MVTSILQRILQWFSESHRWQHLLGGILIGLGADDLYCAVYAGIGIAAALELKDYLWGGRPDWVDFLLTLAGVAIGYSLRLWLLTLLGW